LVARVLGPRFFMTVGIGLALAGVHAGINALTLGGASASASGLSMALTAGLVKASERSNSGEEDERDRLLVVPSKLFSRLGGRFRCKDVILMWRARSDVLAEIGEFKATRGGRRRTRMTIRELADVGAKLEVHTFFDDEAIMMKKGCYRLFLFGFFDNYSSSSSSSSIMSSRIFGRSSYLDG